MWFCYNRNGKKKGNTKYQKKNFKTNTELSKFTDNTRLSNDDKHKKSRIGLLHKHQSPEGIQLTWTIISQIYRKKKDLPTSANDTKSIAYLCDTTTMLWNCLFGRFHKKQFYTRCTQNLFKWHPTQSFNKPIMPFFLKREETQCFRI